MLDIVIPIGAAGLFVLLTYIYSSYFDVHAFVVRHASKPAALLFPAAAALMLFAWVPTTALCITLSALLFLTGFVFLLFEMYYDFSKCFLTFFLRENMRFGSEIIIAVPTLIRARSVLFFLVLPLLLLSLSVYGVCTDFLTHKTQELWVSFLTFGIGLFILILFFFRLRIVAHRLDPYRAQKRSLMHNLSMWGYLFLDVMLVNAETRHKRRPNVSMTPLQKFVLPKPVSRNAQTDAELQKLFDSFRPRNATAQTGIAKGKNLIVIQLECFQNFLLDIQTPEGPLLPNIKAFFHENTQLTHLYSQIGGGNTSDAEFAVINSLLPFDDGSVYLRFPGLKTESLFDLFKKQGFYTLFEHAYFDYYWNRSSIYADFSERHFINDFDSDFMKYKLAQTFPDTVFFPKAFEYLKAVPKPAAAYIVTLSSHTPFYRPYGIEKDDPLFDSVSPKLMHDYLQTTRLTDRAFGDFMQRLKSEGLYDDSVILVYGDHGVFSAPDVVEKFIASQFGPQPESKRCLEIRHVPGALRVPGANLPEKLDLPLGFTDLKPTLCDLFDIPYNYALGRSAFAQGPRTIIFPTHDFIHDGILYAAESRTFRQLIDDAIVPSNDPRLENIQAHVQKVMALNHYCVETNALFPAEESL